MNKVVVITGATGATGKTAARAFAARGDSLVLISRSQEHLDVLAHELALPPDRILTQVVDLTNVPALRSAAEAASVKFGGIHILLHLVGGWTGGKTLVETAPDDFNAMLDQHVHTTFNLFQAFVPHLVESGWGRVLTVSAPVASKPAAKRGAYGAAKAAQEALFLTLAEELKGTGVTANVIVVNAIDVMRVGAGATPEEITAAMLRLCSDEAAQTNGTRLPLYKKQKSRY
jgi:NAD(P)-dependent dehydrogenase (short-subunit alcohol dehydrogenase family)